MNAPRPETDTVSARKRKVRRAKRGLIAGYIHEISGRHNGVPASREAAGEGPGAAGEAPSVAS
jgi:hypothetical protein